MLGGGGGKRGGQKGEPNGGGVGEGPPPAPPRTVPAAAVVDAVATTSKSPEGGGAEMRERKSRKAEKEEDEEEKKHKSSGPTVWFALKKSLHCRSSASDVHDPATAKARAAAAAAASGGGSTTNSSSNSTSSNNNLGAILTRKTARSGCSRSIANLRDVIHGSKRHMERPPSCSPRSIGSSEFLNPITHEVILTGTCELKIHSGFDLTGGGGGSNNGGGIGGIGALGVLGGPTYLGTLRPGTPGPGGHLWGTAANATPSRKPPGLPLSPGAAGAMNGEGKEMNSPLGASALSSAVFGGGGFGGIGIHRASSRARASLDSEPNGGGGGGGVSCHKCGEQFGKWEAAEAHHVSKHAVTELVEGDSSRKIVEIICRTSWQKSETNCARIERVLKVHNTQKTLSRFEEYRETVKLKASKLPKKHPRCLADGNELLRFYGTTLACPLGTGGSSSLCGSDKCSVCRIIRNGFSTREMRSGVGVFTTSTSGRAFESIKLPGEEGGGSAVVGVRKALVVCRVIAGRVHKPLDNIREMDGQTGFDSLAGKVGLYANIEELFLLNPRALLPCFVVVCKP